MHIIKVVIFFGKEYNLIKGILFNSLRSLDNLKLIDSLFFIGTPSFGTDSSSFSEILIDCVKSDVDEYDDIYNKYFYEAHYEILKK